MSGVMVDLVAVILSGLRPHGGFGISQMKTMLMAEIRADQIYEYLPSVSSECVALSSTM